MKSIKISQVTDYVEKNIDHFHQRRLDRLSSMKLNEILKKKNPYLFKAKNILTSEMLIRNLLDAYLSSREETIFGDFIEGVAIFVAQTVFQGKKSPAEGVDLEFSKDGIIYIVSVKSGPNWANSGQIKDMLNNFRKAKRVLRANRTSVQVVAINGCCYGRDNNPDKGEYFKYCGQQFWEFISGNDKLYLDLIVPLGHKSKEKNDEYLEEYSKIVNKFTIEFSKRFCSNNKIDWEALVRFNSSNLKKKN